MISQTCYKNSFYRCLRAEECSARKPRNCAADYFETVTKKRVNILRKDFVEQGFAFSGVEDNIVKINQGSFEVTDENFAKAYTKKILHDDKIVPFPIEPKRRFDYFNVRSSELGQECPLEGIISKFSDEAKEGFEENRYATAGTLMHEIALTQPPNQTFAHNEVLRMIGIEPLRRELYCEKEVEYAVGEIIARGHLDCCLIAGNRLAILDYKRMFIIPYEKISYKFQLGCYKKGVEQSLGRKFDEAFLITIRRPFPPAQLGDYKFDVKGLKRPQMPLITFMRKGDRLDEAIDNRIVFIARQQADVLAKQNSIPNIIEKNRANEKAHLCIKQSGLKCFSYEICDFLHKYISDGEDILKLMMPDFKPAPIVQGK